MNDDATEGTIGTEATQVNRGFVLFPGFKLPPNDPSRDVTWKHDALTGTRLADEAEAAPIEHYDDFDDDEGFCEHCDNSGWVNCFCGGDLCVCDANGEAKCPSCDNW